MMAAAELVALRVIAAPVMAAELVVLLIAVLLKLAVALSVVVLDHPTAAPVYSERVALPAALLGHSIAALVSSVMAAELVSGL